MTAVNWLDEQIQERVIAQDVVARKMIIEISMEDYMDIKRQAKEMEKQQIEISDEEIEKAVNLYANVYQCPSELKMCKHDVISAWNNAIKWYREQLKKKQ